MKLLILSGSHPRHYYITSDILQRFDEVKVICMKRENLLPDIQSIDSNLLKLTNYHFEQRNIKEKVSLGIKTYLESKQLNSKIILPEELNSIEVKEFVKNYNADFAIICGTYILDKIFLKLLPKISINIHLGLSPWYRGSATLFWPNYFLEPWKTGVTFHFLNEHSDSGDIVHQCQSKLEDWMGVHDAAIFNIIKAKNDLSLLVDFYLKNKNLNSIKQKYAGKTFLNKDFKPYHLKLIYELYDDKVIKFLSKRIKFPKIKLIQPNLT